MSLNAPSLLPALLNGGKQALAGVWASICSICWFAAFLSHEVAPVRAVGQVELLFSVGFSILYFKERVTRLELTAMALTRSFYHNGFIGLIQFETPASPLWHQPELGCIRLPCLLD